MMGFPPELGGLFRNTIRRTGGDNDDGQVRGVYDKYVKEGRTVMSVDRG